MRETARQGIDTLAKELRNAGGGQQDHRSSAPNPRTSSSTMSIRAGGGFGGEQCAPGPLLPRGDARPRPASCGGRKQAWSATLPRHRCPSAAFGSQELVADGVVNHAVLRAANPRSSATTPTDLVQLTTIGVDLFVDTDVDREPATTDLGTSVRIRNRNRPPTAEFTATAAGQPPCPPERRRFERSRGAAARVQLVLRRIARAPNWVDGQVVDYQVRYRRRAHLRPYGHGSGRSDQPVDLPDGGGAVRARLANESGCRAGHGHPRHRHHAHDRARDDRLGRQRVQHLG